MNEKNNFRKAGVAIGVIVIALMLTVGFSASQFQQATIVNKKIDTTCHACTPGMPISYDGEDTSICDSISSTMQQIVDAYESGNPIGWSLFFPGYSGESIVAEQVQIDHSGTILFDGVSIQKPTYPSSTIQNPSVPPISEQEIYERASDWLDFCINGQPLGDWIRDLLPGGGGNDPQAYLLAVLQCFKYAAMGVAGVTTQALNLIMSSVALMIWTGVTIIQILIQFADMIPAIAQAVAQTLHALWQSCIDFYYDIYHG